MARGGKIQSQGVNSPIRRTDREPTSGGEFMAKGGDMRLQGADSATPSAALGLRVVAIERQLRASSGLFLDSALSLEACLFLAELFLDRALETPRAAEGKGGEGKGGEGEGKGKANEKDKVRNVPCMVANVP
jgi:hypothetical protein